jgi:hypothetical protein
VNALAALIDDGTFSRTRLVLIVLSSNEAFVDGIAEYYQTFLSPPKMTRLPSAAEAQAWLGALRTGAYSSADIAVFFLSSQEYLGRALALADLPRS